MIDGSMMLMVTGSSEVKEYGWMTRDDEASCISKADDRRCCSVLDIAVFSSHSVNKQTHSR